MRRALLLGFHVVAFAAGGAMAGELNLTPRVDSFDLEGMKMTQLSFDTGRAIRATYQPPRDWGVSGGKDELELRPPKVSQATVKISKLRTETPITLDTESCKALTERVVSKLPQGSENVKVETTATNPLQMSGKNSYVVELSYTFYGQTFASYCLFLARQPEPLRFQLTCRERDYKMLRQLFQQSLYSWQHL